MKFCALQQHDHFTFALQHIGNAALTIESTQAIDRGRVRYFGRLAEFDAQLIKFQRRRRIVVINAETEHAALRSSGYRQILTGASVARLDTTLPIAAHPKWRASLRTKPPRIVHQPLSWAHNWLFDADLAQQKLKRFRAMPHVIAQTWPREDTIVSTAFDAEQPIAAMLFLLHPPFATYQIGWTNDQGRAMNAHHHILVQAIEKLRTRGILGLELGTVDTVNAPGLARFKIGSGAKVIKLGGTWIAAPTW